MNYYDINSRNFNFSNYKITENYVTLSIDKLIIKYSYLKKLIT